jgi:phage terminase large subunit GpA-like protein
MQLTATGAALDIVAGCFRNFAPPPDQPVSTWAAENRVPSRKGSARPGPWKLEPHQPAIMDAMTDPSVRRVVLTGCSQFTGKS